MRILKIFTKLSKGVLLTIMSVVLVLVAVVTLVYTPWFQDALRKTLIDKLNQTPGTQISLDALRLRFPLDLELKGLTWLQNGDTMVVAGAAQVNLAVAPLLTGRIDVERAVLENAVYKMGSPDSATMISLRARQAVLEPANVVLKPMTIVVDHGYLSDSRVDVWVNPNPPKSTSDTTKTTQPVIKVEELEIERLTYTMSLMPTIDSLGVTMGDATLRHANIDLNQQTIDVDSLGGSGLKAALIMPDAEQIANTVVAAPSATSSEPWTVRVRRLDFDKSSALYTTHGLQPTAGFDPAYIQFSDVSLNVSEFYNRAANVVVPVRISGTERCGLSLNAATTLSINETEMRFDDVTLATSAGTSLKGYGLLGVGDMTTDPRVPVALNLHGDIMAADIAQLFPVVAPMQRALRSVPSVAVDADINGTIGNLNLKILGIKLNKHVGLALRGNLRNVMQPDKMAAKLTLDGSIAEVAGLRQLLFPQLAIRIPQTHISGYAEIDGQDYSGKITAVTHAGKLSLDGSFGGKGPDYAFDLTSDDFPVNAFMPDLGVGAVTAHVKAGGHGLDFMKPTAELDADVTVNSIVYNHQTYSGITLQGSLADSHADIEFNSGNRGLDLQLSARGNLVGSSYTWQAETNARDLNLKALGLSQTDATLALSGNVDVTASSNLKDIVGRVHIDRVSYTTLESTMAGDDITMRMLANDSVTNLSLSSRDLFAHFSAPLGVDSLAAGFAKVMPLIDRQIAEHRIDYVTLQHTIPAFRFDMRGGTNNMINQMLSNSGTSFNELQLTAGNDSALTVTGRVLGFATGTTRIDTIRLDLHQHADTLLYSASIGNRPGTLDPWARVDVNGAVSHERITLHARQRDFAGKTGYEIGGIVTVFEDEDDHCTLATLHFDPCDPTIAYQKWTVNEQNYLTWDFTHRCLDADLHMEGAGSSLAIYSQPIEHSDSVVHAAPRDLVVELGNIRLQDWLAMNPFSPAIKGDLSANMRVNYQDGVLTGKGSASLNRLFYGKESVGDFKADVSVLTERTGYVRADADLWVNGEKTMMLHGVLNDSTRVDPLNLDLTMLHFPLATANAFLPGIARLEGTLEGSMNVSGKSDNPRLDGWVAFDSTAVRVDMLGTKFRFDGNRISVVNNQVTFDNYKITGCNDKPLSITGVVDIASFANPTLHLKLMSEGIQLVNSNRAAKGADVYGKAFVSLNADVSGSLRLLNVRANAHLLSNTNVTYVMPDAENVIAAQANSDMVKFVNFSDSLAVAKADTLQAPSGTLMNITALVNIDQGAVVNIDLNTDGTNKVQVKAQGTLDYTATPINPDGRVTGRLNINGGFARYTPPFMSQKLFEFEEGSYVAFNGAMLNPSLNIHAVDHVRANVTAEGQNSRLIYFDVILGVTGTLENMDVKFDLATDDDATVANELASMSESQRASAAMNLLVTNMYSAGNTHATASLGGNALYSFLTSTLNTWMANNIRGVDVSFGINQYDQTVGGASSQATSYSYQVSKSLFDDRFKIVVGGNYTSGGETDENLSETLLNDISLEYLLNKNGTMLVRVFRHTGYESILEGEITQTGVGFVYRRKINRLSSLFRRNRRKKTSTPTLPMQGTVINEPSATISDHDTQK